MNTIKLKCKNCSRLFIKPTNGYKQAIKNGRIDFFCCLSCSTSHNNRKKDKSSYLHAADHLKKYCGNRKDKYSKFRRFIASIKYREPNHNLSLQYLFELWKKQKGICPYTNIKMSLEDSTLKSNKITLKHASLDRIDSSIGYIRGNVEFVCLFIKLC